MTSQHVDMILRRYDVETLLKSRLQKGEIAFDWNGHHSRRKTKPVFPPKYVYEFRHNFGYEESFGNTLILLIREKCMGDITHVLENPGSKVVDFDDKLLVSCFDCGAYEFRFTFDGKTVKAKNPCKYPDGFPPIEVEVNVPSGRLVFENYFQDAEAPERGRLTGAPDFKMETEHYAGMNIGYGACGNSCPSIYRDKSKKKLIMGNPVYDRNHDKVIKAFPGYKRVGAVITDLWAWSAADLDTAKKYGSADYTEDDAIEVVPGRYRVTQLFHKVDYDNNKVVHKFATIERIR